MEIQLRPPVAADSDAIARIVFTAFASIARKHNFPLDFPSAEAAGGLAGFFMNHPAMFGVVAEADGKVVGSNFLDCRNSVAGVGPITVDPQFHGQGVGRKLMQAVIHHGRGAGIASIRLVQDAFNTTSMSLYTSVGFDIKEPLALLMGKLQGTLSASAQVRPMREDDLSACGELCRAIHGFDRTAELRESIKMFNSLVFLRDGKIAAYASAPTSWFLNHGVARTADDMLDLFIGASSANEQPVSLLMPTRQSEIFRRCLAGGLRMVKPMSLMALGDYREPAGPHFPSVQY